MLNYFPFLLCPFTGTLLCYLFEWKNTCLPARLFNGVRTKSFQVYLILFTSSVLAYSSPLLTQFSSLFWWGHGLRPLSAMLLRTPRNEKQPFSTTRLNVPPHGPTSRHVAPFAGQCIDPHGHLVQGCFSGRGSGDRERESAHLVR